MTRWLTIPQYMKETKSGRESVEKLIRNNMLVHTPPEDGNVLIKYETNEDIEVLKKTIEGLATEVKGLCKHLGVR